MRLRFNPALVLLIVLIWTGLMFAQSPLGTITGTISDTQNARVPGVEVTATQVGTGLSFKATSSGDGTYVIPNLPVGRYEVEASAAGFKSFRRTDIVLEVSQRLRLDIALELGALTETITITGAVSRVQMEEATLGSVVERQRIEELPLNGRHVFNLVKLVAGVRPVDRGADGFAEISNQGFSQMTFNGGPVYGNQFYVDGGMNTVPVHNEISVVPMTDAVEEFKVETNSLKAEFGQTSGGVVNVVTKGGTNELHGSLYEFFRNDSLDARHAFATQTDPLTGRIKPILRYNQFGGTVGGPVYLPRIYDGRNRTFFFVGYEQWRQSSSSLRRSTVPTALERTGDFSRTFDSRGNLIPIYDPATTTQNPNGSGFVRQLFAGNVIPSSRFDPVSLRVLEFMPLPNAKPDDLLTNQLNFLSLASTPVNQGVTNIRIDRRFSDKDSLLGRYTVTRNTRQGRGWGLGPADPDIFARRDQRDNHNVIVTETHVFSPAVINEFKANLTRQNLPFLHPSFGGNWPDQLGMPAIFPRDLFPRVAISGMLPLGSDPFAAGIRAQHTIQVGDSITIVKGKHQIKAGVDQRWFRLNYTQLRNRSGNFSFSAGLTGDPLRPAGTGVGMATFLLGEVSGGTQEFVPAFSFHSWSTAMYFQDDYKVTPRLTLNLGLRYDLASEPVERHNRFSNFDPFIINPETNMPGVLTYADVTSPRHFVDRDYNNLGPRFGFAYDVTGDGKTAIRGGYGLIYMLVESGDTQGDNSNSFGFASATPFVPPGGGPFRAFRFSEGPNELIIPLGPAGGPSAFRGQNVRYQDRHAPTPYLQQWNLAIQRELPGRWVGTVAYAGNKGTKLFGGNYNLNQLDPIYWQQYGLGLQDQIENPFFGQITTGALSARKVQRSLLLQPFPDYGSITTYAAHNSSSIYHSLQVTIEKRYASGLSALVSYTNSKLINDSYSSAGSSGAIGEYRLGRFDRNLDRAIDQNDVTHRLVGSAVYELPFGPGKPLLSGTRGVLGHAAGGWQVNTIVTIESGTPLSVRGANNFTGINWPDVVHDPTLPSSERSVQRWFDTDAFRNPPDFVLGNAPRTLPTTRGPGMVDVALSAFKNFPIYERTNLEFRAEAFNAFNHVNHTNPNVTFSPNAAGVNTNAQFGRITNSLAARRIQLGLRLTF
ncbi:MAG: carboxypeptidase regulatory-like domain-containing protein [Bryobacteraceae bacterium]|nr:TonB-dependent receptor [Bryobacterales bacterium]MEB2359917.1 TonB-dependent receptor [Bryobacterales bacterium]NUN01787.1 carboxypeptidase regulatory-like domain-containing protein [Bryobacteraceae bacterium]